MESVVLFSKIASIHCNQNELEAIKSRFKSDIDSPRRYDAIQTIGDLLKTLKKRDCINMVNIQPLIEIGLSYGDAEVHHLIKNYGNNDNINNNLQSIPIKSPPPKPVIVKSSFDAKSRAYKRIAEDIGRDWQDFARALDIKEGRIEELEDQCRKISDRVYKILYEFEENCDTRRLKSSILNALVDARRNDLKNAVQEIFDIH